MSCIICAFLGPRCSQALHAATVHIQMTSGHEQDEPTASGPEQCQLIENISQVLIHQISICACFTELTALNTNFKSCMDTTHALKKKN